ncbi:MAG: hypothetical protein GY765_11735 [bacterium]|nr:hypothetical protein [bacterium]
MTNDNNITTTPAGQEPPVQNNDSNETQVKKKSTALDAVLGRAELMSAAMSGYQELLATKGADEAYVNSFKVACQLGRDLQLQHEDFKAEKKECTAQLKKKMADLKRFMREGRNYIKMAIPQERWGAFGIYAKW